MKKDRKFEFELYLNHNYQTWRAEVYTPEEQDFDGCFYIKGFDEVKIEWYGVPSDNDLWEEIEGELQSTILCHIR